MKSLKKILSGFLLICLMVSLCPSAFADAWAKNFSYEGKSWDQVVEALFERYEVDEDKIGLGYYNLNTSEEHYVNEDKYMVSGSMFKVPLNMLFTEKVSNGKLAMDDLIGGYRYSELLRGSIVSSNNDYAKILWNEAGRWIENGNSVYHRYRELIAPYMGVDPENVDETYYENNFFTPKQMVTCIKLLAENPDRFPGLIEAMQEAEPHNYFKLREQRYDIAHKYGYLTDGPKLYMCDCAIAYTDDPIVFVMFTDGVNKAYDVMADYATLMCGYTQYNTPLRLEAEEKAKAEEAARTVAEAAAQSAEAAEAEDTEKEEAAESMNNELPGESLANAGTDISADSVSILGHGSTICFILVLTALIAVIVLLIKKRSRIQPMWAVLAVVFTVAAVVLSMLGVKLGTIVAKPTGDPQTVAKEFMDSIISGNYDTAYSLLNGYSSLGLENQPSDESGQLMYDALKNSFSYELTGDCFINKLEAKQQLQFTFLDLPATEADIQAKTEAILKDIVASRPAKAVYDEHNNYLPEVAHEAYAKALNEVLKNASEYYTNAGIQLQLVYSDGSWSVIPAHSLIKALSGNTAN